MNKEKKEITAKSETFLEYKSRLEKYRKDLLKMGMIETEEEKKAREKRECRRYLKNRAEEIKREEEEKVLKSIKGSGKSGITFYQILKPLDCFVFNGGTCRETIHRLVEKGSVTAKRRRYYINK